MQDGQLFPNSLISDVPTQMQGYRPQNFHLSYDGVVTSQKALVRSLNVPFVKILQHFGVAHFHHLLQQLKLSTITQSPTHYGLPLILGGAEGRLLEITNAFTCMARTLNHYVDNSSQYFSNDFRKGIYVKRDVSKAPKPIKTVPVLSAGAIFQTMEAMQKVERPDSDGHWENFRSSQKIAWKTGTSIGFRDAWAIGVTPKYAVGVWAGNADGEGRPELIGVKAAAPILFDLFDLLPSSHWFEQPYDDMIELAVCRESGFRALAICPKDTINVCQTGVKVAACNHHRLIHLDSTKRFQVNSDCESPSEMVHQPWFILPPVEGHYYRYKNPNYQLPPPYRADCLTASNSDQPMQFIYPKTDTKIFVPIDINGQLSQTIFKIAHDHPAATLYWHLDQSYLGQTETFHEMGLQPAVGNHVLVVVDKEGNRLERKFEILGKK